MSVKRNGKEKTLDEKYTPQWVRDHLAASERAMKRAMETKESAREMLQRAGILDDTGKLAKPYR